MRKYEVMFVVRPDLEAENIKAVAENMKEVLVSHGAKVLDVKEMGQRDLAYEVKKYHKGYYYLITIEAETSDATKEFDRLALISEDIIRHLIVRVDE